MTKWLLTLARPDLQHQDFLIARGIPVTDEPKDYPNTGPATTPCSLTTRSAVTSGSWRGCREFLLLASTGRSIAHFAASRQPTPIWRARFLASFCRRDERWPRPS